MRTMFKAEWERAKRWHSITQAEAESLSDEALWDCMTSRLPQVEEPGGAGGAGRTGAGGIHPVLV